MNLFECISRLLSIADETLTEFISKATGTAVEWVQMPGMKVILISLSRLLLSMIQSFSLPY